MSKHSVTTEQLAENILRDLKEMSPEEKTNMREQLDKAFGKAKIVHDDDTEHNSILEYCSRTESTSR